MRFRRYCSPVFCLLILSACSDGDVPPERAGDDGVWQVQEDAYRKAQGVSQMLEEADQRRRASMEDQGG